MKAARVQGIRLTLTNSEVFPVTNGAGRHVVIARRITWLRGDDTMTVSGRTKDGELMLIEAPMEELPTWVLKTLLEETTL